MIDNTHRAGGMVVFICLVFVSICYSQDTKTETNDSTTPVTEEDRSKKTPDDEKVGFFDTSVVIKKVGQELQDIVRKERSAALSEIDKERRETLIYLTQERRETMIELEAIGDRIVENTLLKSERLVDHFFLRALQVTSVTILVVCILGFFFYRIIMRRKSQP